MSTSFAWALPANTVIIGNNAYSLDFFFEDVLPAEINEAIMSGGDMYYDAGVGFVDAFSGNDMPELTKGSMHNIVYMNADGTKVIYNTFYDEESSTGEGGEFRVLSIE